MTKAEVLEYLDQLQRLNLDSAAPDALIFARGTALTSAIALVLAFDDVEMSMITATVIRNMDTAVADLAADDVKH